MYHAADGQIEERFPHRYSSSFISHIEAVPFYHFQPGSRTLVLGGAGCNFDCHYCANAYVARSEPEPLLVYDLQPERVITLARQNGCHNIAFAINEPLVALPTLLELARATRAAGIPLGVLTNGYTSPDVAAAMGEAFDFVNVSLKAMQDTFYQDYVGVPSAEPVKRTIRLLHGRTHLEVSTPIVQGLNDGDIPEIAAFLASVDPGIPWHVFRLLPEYRMAAYDRPPIAAVNAALEAAREELPYIYFGNFVGSHWVSTPCPQCEELVVERINLGGCGAKALTYQLEDGHCTACGAAVPIVDGPKDWNSEDTLCASG
jgi:pyruvate-formate lyase-activating enzyme